MSGYSVLDLVIAVSAMIFDVYLIFKVMSLQSRIAKLEERIARVEHHFSRMCDGTLLVTHGQFLCFKNSYYDSVNEIKKDIKQLKEFKMSREEASPAVMYICDGKACEKCGAALGDSECTHTSDVRHAKNFVATGKNSYMEE